MRTSLNDIKTIEAYLDGTLTVSERLFFEARLLVSKELRKNVALQREVNTIVRHHHYLKVLQEFKCTHERLFHDEGNAELTKEIRSIFNPLQS